MYEHTLYNRTVAGLRPYTRSPFNLEIAAQALSKGQISSLIAIWMASIEMLLFLRLYLTIPKSYIILCPTDFTDSHRFLVWILSHADSADSADDW